MFEIATVKIALRDGALEGDQVYLIQNMVFKYNRTLRRNEIVLRKLWILKKNVKLDIQLIVWYSNNISKCK